MIERAVGFTVMTTSKDFEVNAETQGSNNNYVNVDLTVNITDDLASMSSALVGDTP